MIGLSLCVCFGLGLGEPKIGNHLPVGLYPATQVMLMCEALDSRPIQLENPDILHRAVYVRAPFRLKPTSLFALEILLRSAGIYRVTHHTRTGDEFVFITTTPATPPPRELDFEIKIWSLRNTDSGEAADFLNRSVEQLERDIPEGKRTRFVAQLYQNRIIVRYTSEQQLAQYVDLLARLDAPPEDQERPTLESYTCRHLMVDQLQLEFEIAWEKTGHPVEKIIAQKQSNTLLLKISPLHWEEALEILRKLDKPRIKK